jgi:WD repeat-containing protein 48
MAIGAGSSRFARGRSPDERVTYSLRTPEKRPRSGVNALALGPRDLFAAGRDGVVRAWALDEAERKDPAVEARASFDEHVDWCNDVLLVRGGERMLTASSDTTVKVWNAADPSRSLRTLVEHTDYVKALSDLGDGVSVASASLDGRILLWDLATGTYRNECECAADEPSRAASVYCLESSSAHAGMLVAGSTDRLVSAFDTRSGDCIIRLRGHTDSVRCLSMKYDGTLLLSGSSDSTIRLWDMRQQRCVRTFDSHPADSVWALDATRSFQSFVSGGRDGTVWHTAIDGDSASLVVGVADPVPRSSMVLDVVLDAEERFVWVSTTGSTVRKWGLPPPGGVMDDSADPSNGLSETGTASGDNQLSNAELHGMEPAQLTALRHTFGGMRGPLAELRGLPAIIKYKIMNNRRHVMTCDTSDEVSLWDITRGTQFRSLGRLPVGKDLDDFAEGHDEIVAVPSWFQVDIRLGSLSIRLDRVSVANAEVYACDAGLEVDNDDVKVNIGEHVVRGLFAQWKTHQNPRIKAGSMDEEYLDIDKDDASMHKSSSNAGPLEIPGKNAESMPGSKNGSSVPARASSPALNGKDPLPSYTFPTWTPIVVTEADDSPVPIAQRHVGSIDCNLDLPEWVAYLVRDGKSLAKEAPVKIAFTIFPVEDTGLPKLTTVNLNAPRVLRVRKVAAYVAKELNNPADASSALSYQVEASQLEIMCNGLVLPETMNLATVRQFNWRSPEELQLFFRMAPDA